VVAGGLVGSLFGGWVLARLAPSHPMLLALLTGTLFTGAQYLDQSNRSPGSPEWYNLAGLVSFVPPYLLSAFLSNLAGLAPKRLISVKKSAASPSPKEAPLLRQEPTKVIIQSTHDYHHLKSYRQRGKDASAGDSPEIEQELEDAFKGVQDPQAEIVLIPSPSGTEKTVSWDEPASGR
ncbi:hypothetical protein T484DRAFT_1839106, partial [Baffinella frigidus]